MLAPRPCAVEARAREVRLDRSVTSNPWRAVYLDRVGAGPITEHNRITTLAGLLPYVTVSATNADR